MTVNETRASRLRSDLQKWLTNHEMFDNRTFETFIDPEANTPEGAESVYFAIFIDDISDLFYKRENDALREEFDSIIEQHGFWYDFKDAVTLEVMVDETSQNHGA